MSPVDAVSAQNETLGNIEASSSHQRGRMTAGPRGGQPPGREERRIDDPLGSSFANIKQRRWGGFYSRLTTKLPPLTDGNHFINVIKVRRSGALPSYRVVLSRNIARAGSISSAPSAPAAPRTGDPLNEWKISPNFFPSWIQLAAAIGSVGATPPLDIGGTCRSVQHRPLPGLSS